jgi:hypothetical protein
MTEPTTAEETRINASDLIGDFVEKYEVTIRPFLKQGDVRTVQPAILDLLLRFDMVSGDCIHYPHPQIYAAYMIALAYLRGLTEPDAPEQIESERSRKYYLNCLDRQVSELDIAMTSLGGERYQQYRERFKDAI